MVLSCSLCFKQNEVTYPGWINGVNYDADKDLLVEKITLVSSRLFCRPCINTTMQETESSDKMEWTECFSGLLRGDRIQLIAEGAISDFSIKSLHNILEYCIIHSDGENIRQMEQKDPRVVFLLKDIFFQFLREEKLPEIMFLLNHLGDIKVNAECLIALANYFIDKGDFPLADNMLLKAFHCICQLTDLESKNNLLISVGNEAANLTLSRMPNLNIGEINKNILLINTILSKLNYPIKTSIFWGRINLCLQVNIAKMLLVNNFGKALAFANMISVGRLKKSVQDKIVSFISSVQPETS